MRAMILIAWLVPGLSGCTAPARQVTPTPLTARSADGPLGQDYLGVAADLDGDGAEDAAYFTASGDNLDVWVRRAADEAPVKVATVPAAALVKMGLSTFPEGVYEAPCDETISAGCVPQGSMTVTLDHPALALFEYEIGQTMIFWDGEQFLSIAPYE